jgi:hypothetical protein
MGAIDVFVGNYDWGLGLGVERLHGWVSRRESFSNGFGGEPSID